jgi:RNA polymerase sigma-70 factor (ECF subfamily)
LRWPKRKGLRLGWRAELLRRVGRYDQARAAYEVAMHLAHDPADRRLLARRLAELSPSDDS